MWIKKILIVPSGTNMDATYCYVFTFLKTFKMLIENKVKTNMGFSFK